MRKAKFLILFYFSAFCYISYAQGNKYSFKHLTIDNGLSQNAVTCIHQDKTGFIWIGTHDGLNRYDGNQFVQYRNERNNPNSLSNNYIWDIHEDEDGVLWIATFGGGLNSLNPTNGKIRRFFRKPDDLTSFPSNRLFSITEFPKGILWIGSNEGLIRFDKSTEQTRIFLSQKVSGNTLADNYIGIVASDGNGYLWLRSDSGLTRFNTQTFAADYFRRSPYSDSLALGDVSDITIIGGNILVCCEAGLVQINPQSGTDELLLSPAEVRSGTAMPVFLRVLPLSQHRYAIGTATGLVIFNRITNDIFLYQTDAADDKSLSHNNILSLFRSNDGIIWVGTRNGLNKIENERPNFLHIRKTFGAHSLSSKNVSSIIEENDNQIWIGTTDGFNLYNKTTGLFDVFTKTAKKNDGLLSDYILCLFRDSKGNRWLGTRGGGFYKIEMDRKGNMKIARIRPVGFDVSDVNVHFITESKDGHLWIGTGGYGLWKYNPSGNTIKQYVTAKDGSGPNHPFVFTILDDSFNNLWIGTPTGGLNLFNPETEQFLYFQNAPENRYSLSNDIVLSLHEDRQHNLWIGTSSGLNKLIPRLEKGIFEKLKPAITNNSDSLFLNFGQEQGFPNDVIYGMLEDKHRKLWISTNKGLAVFDMDKQKVVKTFDVNDGLQSREFNQNAYYKSISGQFYFGGVNGLNIFHPDSIRENQFIPPVVLTGLSLFNEPVRVGNILPGKDFHLEKALYLLDKIRLSWKHKVITFEFAALSFISPEKNQFSYKLEGFNDDWIQAGTTHSATYTNLPPGNYIFRVRAGNSSGLWNEKGAELKVYISSPPWLSWYAYLTYFLMFLGVVFSFIRFRINKSTREIRIRTEIEKARSQERADFRKRSAADFHDEAGNMITKITLFTEMARAEMNDNSRLENYLDKIQLNVSELSAGMRDFLWVMDPLRDSLFETIVRLKDFGDSGLKDVGIEFSVSGMKTAYRDIILPMNTRRAVLQIFKEAINNCARHSGASDARLSVKLCGTDIHISLKDNGKGFDMPEENSGNNYGMSIMPERAKNIGAVLTVTSQKNTGTAVSLKFTMPRMGNS